MLNISKKIEDGKAVFALEGRLDTVTAPDLEKELKGSLDGIQDLVMDFEKLEYISSAGLRVLLSAQKVMTKQGKMVIIHVNESIMEIFEVTGFADILTIE
ncbi:MAG: STAS domain-containing protein [Oscillospiraceae bacterium]|nr:STAS domain-containing protein [Oscillospiraceae bacterium]